MIPLNEQIIVEIKTWNKEKNYYTTSFKSMLYDYHIITNLQGIEVFRIEQDDYIPLFNQKCKIIDVVINKDKIIIYTK